MRHSSSRGSHHDVRRYSISSIFVLVALIGRLTATQANRVLVPQTEETQKGRKQRCSPR